MKLTKWIDVLRYVKVVAAKANVNVKFEKIEVPFCTKGCVHLPDINEFTTEEKLATYLYFIEHEAAHAAHTDFDAPRFPAKSLASMVQNILEDFRIDTIEGDMYDGFKSNRAAFYERHMPEMAAIANEKLKEGKEVDIVNKLTGVFAWVYLNDRSTSINTCATQLIVSPECEAFISKLRPLDQELLDLVDQDTAATVPLTKKILTDVLGEKEEPKTKEELKAEGKGEGEEEEGSASGPPKKGKGEAKGEDGFGNLFDHKSGVPQGRAIDHDYEPVITRDSKIECSTDKFVPNLPDQIKVISLSNGEFPYGTSVSTSNCRNAVRRINSEGAENFAAKVRRLLQLRAKSRYEYGLKNGKLDQARLARITLKDTYGFADRVFKKRVVSDTVNTAASVLLDASGSMSGGKWAHAIKAAQLLNATVSNALGIPLEVLAFTDDPQTTILFEAKTFNQLRTSDDDMVNRLAKAAEYMSGNADGEAILHAYNRLLARREKRKVLIVISDGMPCCSRDGDIDKFTERVVKSIEADRRVDLFGLGLMSDSVRRYYKKHEIVHHGASLEEALLKLIDKSLT